MPDPGSMDEQRRNEELLEIIVAGVSASALGIIARGLRDVKDKKLDYAGVYQSFVGANQEYHDLIASGQATLSTVANQIFDQMASQNDTWAKRFYDAMGVKQYSAKESEALRQALENGKKESLKYIEDHLNTSVLGIVDRDGNLHAWGSYYRKKCSEAVTALLTGEEAYDSAITGALQEMTRSGLREGFTVDKALYKSGSRDIYGAMRTNIMDNYRQTLAQMRYLQGIEYGADGVEVSAHFPCADDHIEFQGNVYTYEELEKNMPDRPLETGANCRHTLSHVIVSVANQTKAYTDEQLEQLRELSEEEVTITTPSGGQWSGTRYEASQYQRRLEQDLRKLNTEKALSQMAGADTSDVDIYIKDLTAAYRRLSRDAGLGTRMERTVSYIAI